MKNILSFLFIFSFISPVKSSPDWGCKKDIVKVLTLNTWMIPVLRKKAKARTYIIAENIKKFDLVNLQEMFAQKLRKHLVGNVDEAFVNRYQTTPFYFLNSGLFTLSKLEIIETDFLTFTNCGGIQCASLKGVLYLRVKTEHGFEIDLFSTHLQAYQKDEWVRDFQMLEARYFIDQKSSSERTAIFVGDFNIIAGIPEHEKLKNTLFDFRDVWVELKDKEPGYTWNPNINVYAKPDHEESSIDQRIDYIFVRNPNAQKIKILDVNLEFTQPMVSSYSGEKLFASDHFGLSSEIEISENCYP